MLQHISKRKGSMSPSLNGPALQVEYGEFYVLDTMTIEYLLGIGCTTNASLWIHHIPKYQSRKLVVHIHKVIRATLKDYFMPLLGMFQPSLC